MKQYFPSLILEDKDNFNGGGNVVQRMKMAGESMAAEKLNVEWHVPRSREAKLDKSSDVKASPPVIHRSIRERHRNIRLEGYHTLVQVAASKESIGYEEELVTPVGQHGGERLVEEDSSYANYEEGI